MEKKIPYIDPDNAMSKEDMARFIEQGEGKPVVELNEGVTQPLAIYAVDLLFRSMPINIMMTVTHNVKPDTIELRCRTRFDESGRKEVLGTTAMKHTPENYQMMIEKMHKFVDQAKEDMGIVARDEAMLLEFKVGESMENIMHQMERSNRFNIGVVDKDEYERSRK